MCEGSYQITNHYQTKNAICVKTGVRQWEISSIVKRERAQTNSYGPKIIVQWKRMWEFTDSQDVGLEAAIHLKSA